MEYEGEEEKNKIKHSGNRIWRGEGKSKQQIKEDIENFMIKENIEEAKVKDCYKT
jgi:hypothetical protein